LEDAPLVEETRAVGLLGAVQLSAEARAEDPGLADRIVFALQDEGVLVRSLVGHSLQISPPFVISEQEIGLLAERLGGVLEREARRSGSGVPA
jgi:adenosylmethionine-8-amino-7-oxononanoate aminotransferase